MSGKQFKDATTALNYLMSGNAVVTLVSRKTGQRFTYKITRPYGDRKEKRSDQGFRFVKLLNGPDNVSGYQFMGIISNNEFALGRKAKMTATAPSVVAFNWVFGWLQKGELRDEQVEIWHEGRCGKCGRRLTVPQSIETGIGPECAKTVFVCK